MSEPFHAVFLSYASQDAEAAQKICEALRAAGIEVWFDQSQLRGGDIWDQRIRQQIRDCALFMPVISAWLNCNDRFSVQNRIPKEGRPALLLLWRSPAKQSVEVCL